MSEFLVYEAKTAIIISVFYLFYRMLVRKDTFHSLNRIILITSVVISFILPLCVIKTTQTVFVEQIQIPITQIANMNQLDAISNSDINNHVNSLNLLYVLGIMYIIGVITMSIYMAIAFIKVDALIKRCKVIDSSNNINICLTNDNITPCSWFNNIILPKSECDDSTHIIVAHEKAHIKLKHSWDVVFINICKVLQWFNPLIWLLSADLKEIHEYQADRQVLSEGFNPKEYQLLLIKKAVGNKSYSIANNLNHSTLKNRITMMLSKKSSVASRCKLLYILPLIGISLTVFAQTDTVIKTENKDNQNKQIFVSPIESLTLNVFGKYGEQKHPIIGTTINHSGIDIKVAENTPILAAMDGTVTEAGFDSNGKGNRIILSHSNGYETEYAHLSSYKVSKGNTVKASQEIGKAGNTGKSTSTHLHFEVRQNGKNFDPLTILNSTSKSQSAY